jgi:hypothetical protein
MLKSAHATLREPTSILPLSLLVVASCLPIGARLLAGAPGAEIHVRWQPSVSDSARRALESRFRLADGQRLDAGTWRYDLTDPRTDTVRALVTDASVADTHDLDRSTYEISPSAVRTGRRQRLGNAGAALVRAQRADEPQRLGSLDVGDLRGRRSQEGGGEPREGSWGGWHFLVLIRAVAARC